MVGILLVVSAACFNGHAAVSNQASDSSLNQYFHELYDQEVARLITHFGKDIPVLMNLGGTLVFKYNDATYRKVMTPALYQQNKIVGHVLFATYLLLKDSGDQHPLSKLKRQQVKNFLLRLKKNEAELTTDRIRKILISENEAYLREVLSQKKFDDVRYRHFFATSFHALKKLVDAAAKAELDLLDQTVQRWLSSLSPDAMGRLKIVVATAHQARAEEISLQYFTKKFKATLGAGAIGEDQILVLENQFSEKAALQLLARHILDQNAASLILQDQNALQKDLLDASAKKWLQKNL